MLAAEFGCARATVNRAMRALADSGIIERRRKAGSRVALHPIRKAKLDIPITRLEVEGRGQTYRFRLLNQDLAALPPIIASRLDMTDGSEFWHLRMLHLADGLAFAFEDRWLNPAVLPKSEEVDFNAISANEWLVQNITYTKGDIAFSAENPQKEAAEQLGVEPNCATFIIERTTWHHQTPITAVRLTYAPGYRLHTQL